MQSRATNPFEDPAPILRTLDDDPFDSSSAPSAENPFGRHDNDSAIFDGPQHNDARPGPSSYGVESAQDKKARELQAKEEELRMREQRVRDLEAQSGTFPNNWPPFFPIVHHDLTLVSSSHRQTMTFMYYLWLALILTLIVNLLGCIFLLIAGSSEGGADTAAAGGYLPVIGALSFLLWYRPIYLGYVKEGTSARGMAFFFYLYFLFAGFHLLFSIYMAIGIPSTGAAGLINTISMFSQGHILAGVFGAISSFGWILQSAGGGILYKRVWDFKNGNSEITLQEATNQFKKSSIKTIVMHQAQM